MNEDEAPTEQEMIIPPDLLMKIPIFKEEYGDLYLCNLGEQVFAFRPLTLAEIDTYDYLQAKDVTMAEELMFNSVLYPDNAKELIDDMGIGDADRLLYEIANATKIPSIEAMKDMLNFYRNEANSTQGVMISWICAAFPGFTPKKIRQMTEPMLLKHLALAENILQKQLELEDPNKKKKQKQKFGAFSNPFPTNKQQQPAQPIRQQATPMPKPHPPTTTPMASSIDFMAEARRMMEA